MDDNLAADQVLNALPEGVVAVDGTGIVRLWNFAAAEALALTASEALGRPVRQIAPFLNFDSVLSDGQPLFYEERISGTKHLLISIAPIRDAAGQVGGAVAILFDVLSRGMVLEEISSLQQVKLLLEAIIDATQDVISVADAEGNLMLVNQAYTRVIGLNKEEVIGKSATVDINEGESMHIHVMETLEPVHGVPMQVGPQHREVLVNAAPVLVQGELKGSVLVAHDVSEILKLTEELHVMKSLVRHMQSRYTFEDIVAEGPEMKHAVEQARKAAASSVTVLLTGESGTGKELFAHAIHHASQRKNGSFVRVNCSAIPETLLESELFGYEAGAFTGALKRGKKGFFEEASGGTLFLDEIGEIPFHLQAKMLRALQEKEITRVGGTKSIPVQIRIIAATNRNLAELVRRGEFREDLYYRISVFPIIIPPLRLRQFEFPQLVRHLLRKLNAEYGRHVQQVSEAAMLVLKEYSWPGNVRELENILARSMISMAFNATELNVGHLPPLEKQTGLSDPVKAVHSPAEVIPLAKAVETAEKAVIIATLEAVHYNKTAAARLMEISVRNLYYKMERYGLLEQAAKILK